MCTDAEVACLASWLGSGKIRTLFHAMNQTAAAMSHMRTFSLATSSYHQNSHSSHMSQELLLQKLMQLLTNVPENCFGTFCKMTAAVSDIVLISHYVQNEITWPLCSGPQLWWPIPAVPKESHSIWASIQQNHRPDAIHDPQPKFPYSIPLETWNAMFGDHKGPSGSDNGPNAQHCWNWTTLKR